MNKQSDQREQRLELYWYVALIAMPVIVALLLFNADPYERVQLNKVIELRSSLSERQVGTEVIGWLDGKGGHNLSDQEWLSIQEVNAEQLYFMLNSSQHNAQLKGSMKKALADRYVTEQEYQRYLKLAATALMDKQTLSQYGYR